MSYITSTPPNQAILSNTKNAALGQTLSQDPLSYVSPQSAIAAGLDATQVRSAWSRQINSFSSVQEAIQAGIAPTVVTEYWTGGSPPVPVSWWDRSTFGISNKFLAAGGAVGLLALFASGSHR